MLLVVGLEVLAHLVVRTTGGLPNAFGHLPYVGVVIAAYRFGWRAGALAGVLGGFLMGPFADLSGVPNDGQEGWITRTIAYVGVGALTGLLFERVRASTDAWRETAQRVTAREREGMTALARGAEAKDTDTGGHIRRVQEVSEGLALAAGLAPDQASAIGWAGMLHDVGKLHVPDAILLKPGPLTSAEWDIMRRHSIWGEQILADGDGFALARRIARWHHENFDGTGYPDGLMGTSIPLEARIVRIADAFDTMTHGRPYQAPRSTERAFGELMRWSGQYFDPELVRLLIELARCDARDIRRTADAAPAHLTTLDRAGSRSAAACSVAPASGETHR